MGSLGVAIVAASLVVDDYEHKRRAAWAVLTCWLWPLWAVWLLAYGMWHVIRVAFGKR